MNYRDMGPEELGSVYESLLELVPDLQGLGHPISARLAFVGDDATDASAKGNTRKLTGSYYTPDSLVQELIKSALDPVIAQTLKSHPQRPVEALLELSICDPACGSGHFLLAAARRLADEVSLHRAAAEREGGAPTPVDYRHALRDVVSHCIYGVDKNPMAIQLAKTALWLEAYSPDRPLSFVDHHLRVGDALLGVLDPKVLEQGIPDEAYTALLGDDKSTVSALKKQNKADLKSWRAIASGDLLTLPGLASYAASVETLDDDTPEHLAAKRLAWQAADLAAHNSTFARLADTYVAAFLAPKLADSSDVVPLSGYLWGVLSGQPARAELENAAQALCRRHGVFHWWLAFPQVAAKGGFSVMLGNPPWEQLQLSEEEFFAARAPSIAAMAGAKRKSAIAALEYEAPWLWSQLQDARRQNDAANLFFRASGRFPLSAHGKLDTYPLFSETFLQATRENGRSGFIVKAGIATDDSNKRFFAEVVERQRLVSLLGFDNAERIFPAVHPDTPFVLVTLGAATKPTQLLHYALRVEHLQDPRRKFSLTRDEFALINPNTQTCPVFRSERDAELTKKLYRSAPVLIKEAVVDAEGNVLQREVNEWSIAFSQGLFNMTSDSGLFRDIPAAPGQWQRLPMYEAKMVHQFDHRWATYVDSAGSTTGEVQTADLSDAQKADPTFTARPRYWVDEREVLARLAQVPTRIARAWLALHAAQAATDHDAEDPALAELLLALAQWVAGELFHRAAGKSPSADGWTPAISLPHIASTEAKLKTQFPNLNEVLRAEGMTSKKALALFPKWALQTVDLRLADEELTSLADALVMTELTTQLLRLVGEWMDRRSPRWMMGWRDITNATNERTVIASVVPRAAVGNNMPLMFFGAHIKSDTLAALLGNLCALTLDFVARHKVGGTHLNYFIYKQLPVLSPDRYTQSDLAFIVPRVLELTYTTHDLKYWAEGLAHYDARPVEERNKPFAWNSERRAWLRAELDAFYARLYHLTREELRYILDPVDVMGSDYPSETFRVLKEGELRSCEEYRTRRLVLEAWDRHSEISLEETPVIPVSTIQYSEQGMIRNSDEAELAGLIVALVERFPDGCTVTRLQNILARSGAAAVNLEATDIELLRVMMGTSVAANAVRLVDRIHPIVQRLEAASVFVRHTLELESFFRRGEGLLPADVSQLPQHADIARLLLAAESRHLASRSAPLCQTVVRQLHHSI